MKRNILALIVLVSASWFMGPLAQARTLGEIKQLIRGATGEDSSATSSFSDSALTQWANEAQDWVAAITGPIARDTTIEWLVDTGSGLARITMQADFISVHFAMVLDLDGGLKGVLVRSPPDSIGLISAGYGSYLSHGRTLILDGYQLEYQDSIVIYYFSEPADMTTDASDCEINDVWEPMMIDYIFHRIEQSKRFMSSAAQLKQGAKADLADSRKARELSRQTE